MSPRSTAMLAALALAAAGCTDPGSPPPRYPLQDVAEASGLTLTTTSGRTPSTQLLEVKGGGIALLDWQGDGDLDVFVPNGATLERPDEGPGARLFENTGGLRFRDATSSAGITLRRWGFGCAVGDVNADGREDLFVACYGQNALLVAGEDGVFVDASEDAGFTDKAWSTAAAFGDLDGDTDLDLYVANYVVFDPTDPPPPMEFRGARVFGGPMGLEAAPDAVYENLGGGRFRDVTEAWGFAAVRPSYGLGVLILDLDADGRAEVFVGNDSQANFLFRRDDAGTFTDVGVASGIALAEHGWGQATMGIAVGDPNGDGRADVFTSNFAADHDTLHLNRGDLLFEDVSRPWGLALVSVPYLGWAAAFVDLDHDRREELLVFHGHVYPETVTGPMGWRHAQEPTLFENVGGRFEPVPPAQGGAWLAEEHCDRSAAFGDLDGDGDVDVVVGELGGPLRLLRNDAAAGGWLRVQLRDAREASGNPRGIGAHVVLEDAAGTQHRWIASGTSYQSASALEAHFGLGEAPGAVRVRVRWPDGFEQTVEDVAFDPGLTVERR